MPATQIAAAAATKASTSAHNGQWDMALLGSRGSVGLRGIPGAAGPHTVRPGVDPVNYRAAVGNSVGS
ncbi:hypothetical protein MMAD_31130 [Mycolicibacterium madagascariense]|uniref:Uncharacterized protein n=1 Tax=Mycolicibacterium madagascariense TaxID=212765 RepID=A0A7I7XHZ1_9MYCO|nr:hypothetical protein MMAD_31130 [Mycolicibacterium madagascariense]